MSKNHGIEKAYRFLQDNIARNVWSTESRLPPSRQLATMAGVSPVTMLKAINTLKKEKVLYTRERSSICINAQGLVQQNRDQPLPLMFRDKWKTVAEKMKEDIIAGTLSESGQSLSIKEMINRYKSSFRMVKKALDLLIAEKVVETDKRAYKIQRSIVRKSYNQIYLLLDNNTFNGVIPSWDIQDFQAFLMSLEKECSARNIQIIKLSIQNSALPIKSTSTLGFVLWKSYDPSLPFDQFERLIHSLKTYKKPIAIIGSANAESSLKIAQSTKISEPIFTFKPITEYDAGFLLGRFLYAKGHKKICYFAYSREQLWLMEYYKGLCQAYESLNIAHAVIPFFGTDLPLSDVTSHPLDQELMDRIIEGFNFVSATNSAFQKAAPFFPESIMQNIKQTMEEASMSTHAFRSIVASFRSALAIADATAWIGVEWYFLSLAAFEFLKANTIAVPGKLGIAGFTEQLHSSIKNCTCFNYNQEGIAKSALNAIIYPELALKMKKKNNGKPFVVEGYVVDRGSI